jgi:hypothetical protein
MVYPLNEDGRLIYVTALDRALAGDLTFALFIGTFALSAFILIAFKPFADRGKE